MNNIHSSIETARELLRNAKSVFVITGAGISGEWSANFRDPMILKISIRKVATPQAFQRDPEFVWSGMMNDGRS